MNISLVRRFQKLNPRKSWNLVSAKFYSLEVSNYENLLGYKVINHFVHQGSGFFAYPKVTKSKNIIVMVLISCTLFNLAQYAVLIVTLQTGIKFWNLFTTLDTSKDTSIGNFRQIIFRFIQWRYVDLTSFESDLTLKIP